MGSYDLLCQKTEAFLEAVKIFQTKTKNNEFNISKPEFGDYKNFPVERCKDASVLLYKYLLFCGLATNDNSKIVTICYGTNAKYILDPKTNKDKSNHFWLLCSGYHIDITYIQFNKNIEWLCDEKHPLLEEKYPLCWEAKKWEASNPGYYSIGETVEWMNKYNEVYEEILKCIS